MAFILSKILWMFTAPGNLLVLLLLAFAFLSMARNERWQLAGRRLCFDIAFLMFFIAIFPIGDWLLRPLENRFPPVTPDHVEGIIIIGSDENAVLSEARGQPIVRGSAGEYLVFATLARQYPQAKLVYAGGTGLLGPVSSKLSNADVAKQALTGFGIPLDRMVFESQSRNTHENAVDAAALVHPKPQEKWLLVTSAFHMPRSIASFRKEGWNVYAAPANYYTTGKLNSDLNFNFSGHIGEVTAATHEYYGLLSYWLMGYINSPWPK